MKIDAKTALVLEGGGLRGVFTYGVLDCFMDRGIRFPFTIGVSAGACNGLSYMSYPISHNVVFHQVSPLRFQQDRPLRRLLSMLSGRSSS